MRQEYNPGDTYDDGNTICQVIDIRCDDVCVWRQVKPTRGMFQIVIPMEEWREWALNAKLIRKGATKDAAEYTE